MSPTSRRRKKKQRRSPNRTKSFTNTMAQFVASARSPDVLYAELVFSELIGRWWSTAPENINVMGGRAIRQAKRARDADALALLTGLAAMTTGALAAEAAAAANALAEAGVPAPPWADTIGKAVPGECWRLGDVFGEQVRVLCCFDGPMGAHAVCVLIDQMPQAVLRDAWVVVNPDKILVDAQRAIAEHRDRDLLELRRISQAEARGLIEIAFRPTNITSSRRSTSTLADLRALVLARSRLLPQPSLPTALTVAEQAELVTEFVTDTGLGADDAARRCAERYVQFWSESPEDDPLWPNAMMASEFFDDVADQPITPAEIRAMPTTVIAFLRWAAKRRRLPDSAVELLTADVERSAASFGEDGFERVVLSRPRTNSYVVRVGLDGVEPPVWRRLRVPGDLTMAELHTTLHVAFGWSDSGLHTFTAQGLAVGDPDGAAAFYLDETEVFLSELAPEVGATLGYVRDNIWRHLIEVERIEAPDSTVACLDGQGTVPQAFSVRDIDDALRANLSRR